MSGSLRNGLLALVLLALLGGCMPALEVPEVEKGALYEEAQRQRELAFSIYIKREERLWNVALPLLRAASMFCDKHRGYSYGLVIHDVDSYGDEYRQVARRYFSIYDDGIYVRYVHPDLPAGRMGLQAGDRILSVNGISTEGMSIKEVGSIIKNSSKRLSLTVRRDTHIEEFELLPDSVCNYDIRLVVHDAVNAFADGKNVTITTGMIRFAESDQELALVLGHEIAHNVLGHVLKTQGNILVGTLFDILIESTTGVSTEGLFAELGAEMYSQEFEAEADYMGLYIVARAGYEIKDAHYFWRRMAVEHPASIKTNFSATHPSTPQRFIALENTIKEIEEKKKRGAPLVPEKRR